jgi:hypothetical protein
VLDWVELSCGGWVGGIELREELRMGLVRRLSKVR